MPLLSVSDLMAPDALECTDLAKTLGGMYTKHLANFNDNGPKREPGIHASEISKCYRQMVYTMRGEPKFIDPNESPEDKAFWKSVMDHGHAIHGLIQGHFHQMAKNSGFRLTFEDEVRLRPDLQPLAQKWNIYSSCDGLFTFWERDPTTWRWHPIVRVGLEIKSAKSDSWDKLKEPKPEHIEQLHVYMAVLDIPIFWVLYYNKDTQSITPPEQPWLVRFDHRLWRKIEQRFALAHDHLNKGTLPDPMPGSHCEFCPYKQTCNPPKRQAFKPRSHTLRRPAL